MTIFDIVRHVKTIWINSMRRRFHLEDVVRSSLSSSSLNRLTDEEGGSRCAYWVEWRAGSTTTFPWPLKQQQPRNGYTKMSHMSRLCASASTFAVRLWQSRKIVASNSIGCQSPYIQQCYSSPRISSGLLTDHSCIYKRSLMFARMLYRPLDEV